jgi:hypothetical protein
VLWLDERVYVLRFEWCGFVSAVYDGRAVFGGGGEGVLSKGARVELRSSERQSLEIHTGEKGRRRDKGFSFGGHIWGIREAIRILNLGEYFALCLSLVRPPGRYLS